MKLSPTESAIMHELEQMPIIDAHEHLNPERVRLETPVDVMTLFSHYTQGDLRVAGMSDKQLETIQDHSLPLEYRWRLFEPYWNLIKGGCYARAALLAAQRFYNAEDINADTYEDISQHMQEENTPGLYQRVLREACNITTALTQCQRLDVDKPLLTPVMPLVPNMWELDQWSSFVQLSKLEGARIRSLDDLLDAGRLNLHHLKSEGCPGLKMLSNPYQSPSRKDALECFEQLRLGTIESLPMVNPLRDFIIDEMIRYSGELDLVVCVHTGYWGDFRTLDPLHMIPILERHPEVRFDMYHLGYPWMRESIMLGKGFPNVWLNFCWTHVISQRFAMDAMDEVIEMIPHNKVIGFGGDYNIPVEKVYGHLVMAREDFSRVLAARLERGLMTEEQAISLARAWLYENPKNLYRLDV